ncbi:restriction endonuclease [Streptomyces sp. NPDC020807]|uniref:restriction endonuclease n=1 Tax=Streptomyces sp. NPDC020807 TaxID=3155119 RepID=UPI0033FD9D95
MAGAGVALVLVRRETNRREQVRLQGLRYLVEHLDGLGYTQFEYAIRDLMRRYGFQDARQVGGSGDNGADVKGTGRQVHDGDVIVMLTNGRFSKKAPDFAESQRLHLVDRHLLARWAVGSDPPWDLLQAVPPSRRPAAR